MLAVLGERADHEHANAHHPCFTKLEHLAAFERVEPHPRGRTFQAVLNRRIRSDANHPVHLSFEQRQKPRFANELPVGCEPLNARGGDDVQHAFEQGFAFKGVAVTRFLQVHPSNWQRNAVMGDADHEEVDVQRAELSVGTVHGQDNFVVINKSQYEASDQLLGEINVKKAFDAP